MANDFNIKHASLFTGIGGFDIAAEWVGWENIFQVELNEFCQNKLIKNFPNVTKYKDITKFDGTPYARRIDVLTGGFPCQSFSVAGKGTTDLTLWKEMLRTITEIKPPFVVAENVPGIVSRKNAMAFNTVCFDLEIIGYEIQPLNIPVAGKGAPHERERIWFIAYSDRFRCDNEQKESGQTICNEKRNGAIKDKSGEQQCGISKSNSHFTNSYSIKGREQFQQRCSNEAWAWEKFNRGNTNASYSDKTMCMRNMEEKEKRKEPEGSISDNSNTTGKRLQGRNQQEKSRRKKSRQFRPGNWDALWYEVATRLCRMDDGIPGRMDRIKALGNSIAPILAFEFFRIIDFCIKEGRKKNNLLQTGLTHKC